MESKRGKKVAQSGVVTREKKEDLVAEEPFVVSFPADTLTLIDKLAGKLNIDRFQVIAKGLGLLELWVDARDEGRLIVERPKKGFSGEEYEIDIADNPPS